MQTPSDTICILVQSGNKQGFNISMQNTDAKKLLILDLDETLIHGCPGATGADFFAAGIPVFIRPHARHFLLKIEQFYIPSVWTSASSDYAKDIVREIFASPPAFVWCRERCVRRYNPETLETDFIKDLKKIRRLGWDLSGVLVVDDSPEKLSRNYGNLVRVPPFTGGSDNVLARLAEFLITLSRESDVRRVEKRGWLT